MIVALGEWILRTACAQNRAWQDAGLPPLCVSVNVSPRQFEEARLVERVQQALRDSGLAPEWLELEVTEGVIMRDLRRPWPRWRRCGRWACRCRSTISAPAIRACRP
jgi:EAL domain-containing protein (putative c-di-GMP-specific phosphodiesterase class I)